MLRKKYEMNWIEFDHFVIEIVGMKRNSILWFFLCCKRNLARCAFGFRLVFVCLYRFNFSFFGWVFAVARSNFLWCNKVSRDATNPPAINSTMFEIQNTLFFRSTDPTMSKWVTYSQRLLWLWAHLLSWGMVLFVLFDQFFRKNVDKPHARVAF